MLLKSYAILSMSRTFFHKPGAFKGALTYRHSSNTSSHKAENKRRLRHSIYDDSIVVSGISGRFPSSADMEEFKRNLLRGSEMTTQTEERWRMEGIPKRSGFLSCLDKFDAQFFNLTPRQAHQLDPPTRLLLEASFEAIMDAGYNPRELRYKRTGVFCGSAGGEALDNSYFRWNSELTGSMAVSLSSYNTPARIAFALDLRGPSAHISTACSSGLAAIEMALHYLRLGLIDAAIVTGSNCILNPRTYLEFTATGALAMDGRCKVFDESADGFVRAELAVAVLLQKDKGARRSYGRILNVCSNTDGFKHVGLSHPVSERQEELIRLTYEQVGLVPEQVVYVEAHGTGTAAGDPEEVNSILRVFCGAAARTEPLLVGSVKSNMGHGESGAAMASLAKVIVATQTGMIPANLHFKTPRVELRDSMNDGKIKVITENTQLAGGLIGINAFGLGGTNSHLIFEPGKVLSDLDDKAQTADHAPVLIPMAGRTEEKLRESLSEACVHASNPEFVYLLQSSFAQRIPGLPYRGFALLSRSQKSSDDCRFYVEHSNCGLAPPLWIIFPPMGMQWAGMGQELMSVVPFAKSIQRSSKTLKNVQVELSELLDTKNASLLDNIHDAFVATTAIQIALWDTLKHVIPDLNPDGLIGHSHGELLCAYADGCLTAEETLLIANARGRAFKDGRKILGKMATIGMCEEQVRTRLPTSVQLACINSSTNVTVSGEAHAVTEFVRRVKTEGYFAAIINSCDIACHSCLMEEAGEVFLKYAHGIIQDCPEDRLRRSSRWVSTVASGISDEQTSSWGDLACIEYLNSSMRLPVHFHQALQKVPAGSVVVELSPKGYLHSILSDSPSGDYVLITPMSSEAKDKLSKFYESFGQMYSAGLDVNATKLYPQVSLPVAASTPHISPLINWDHSDTWKTHIMQHPLEPGYETFLDLSSATHGSIEGHRVQDSVVFPATGYICLAWSHFADALGMNMHSAPVVIHNVTLQNVMFLSKDVPTKLFYTFLAGSGRFEIKNGSDIIACGTIERGQADTSVTTRTAFLPSRITNEPPTPTTAWLPLSADDVYKEFRLRELNYSGNFRGIANIDNEGKWAQVCWKGDWVAFLDSLLQTTVLTSFSKELTLPVEIEKIEIDPVKFLRYVAQKSEDPPTVRVDIDHLHKTITCPGVQIKALITTVLPSKIQSRGTLAYERHVFCPYIEHTAAPFKILQDSMWEIIDLVLENSKTKQLKVMDLLAHSDQPVIKIFNEIMAVKTWYRANLLTVNHTSSDAISKPLDPETDVAFLDDPGLLHAVVDFVKPFGFVLLVTTNVAELEGSPCPSLALVSRKTSENLAVSLYRKFKAVEFTITHIQINEKDHNDFEWVSNLQSVLNGIRKTETSRIYITSQDKPTSGILGLVKCLLQEEGTDHIRCIFDPAVVLDLNFDKPCAILKSVIEKDLTFNVVKDGRLGSYRHLPLHATTGMLKKTEFAQVSLLRPGDLASLQWTEASQSPYYAFQHAPSWKMYNIAYSALNFRDVLTATGAIPMLAPLTYDGPNQGFEFSGWDLRGNRVMGIGAAGLIATAGWAELVWPVPTSWTLEEAATVPVAYSTVYYAFYVKARLKLHPGQSILIHSGAGGTGLAAISVARAHGCRVFTTVGTEGKKEFLMRSFPEIKDEYIGNSRDASFKDQFLQVTNGRGVDIVLNSLEGEKLLASIGCLARNGIFLDISVKDALNNTALGMRPFLRNIEFIAATLPVPIRDKELDKRLTKEVADGIATGAVQPLPRHVFLHDQTQEAYRFMAKGKRRGKVVLKIRDKCESSTDEHIVALGRSWFSNTRAYIIVGGLGGFGLEVADWMIQRGARNLIIPSRSGVTNGYQSRYLRKWTTIYKASIVTPIVDLSSKKEAQEFFRGLSTSLAETSGVAGILNCALVLRDDEFCNQTQETFTKVAAPKVLLTENLDSLSRIYCSRLEYFVVFSSTASGKGIAEQTNYGWANSASERICENRKSDGFHGLAIQWGWIGQVGYSTEKVIATGMKSDEAHGVLPQHIKSCLQILDVALQQREDSIVSSFVAAPERADDMPGNGMASTLVSRVQRIFGIKSIESLDPKTKLSELGMDSIISFELKQILTRDFNLSLTREALRTLTVVDLLMIQNQSYSGLCG